MPHRKFSSGKRYENSLASSMYRIDNADFCIIPWSIAMLSLHFTPNTKIAVRIPKNYQYICIL